ncbi:hypothetical protein [Pseudoalteromonas denitrificans]|uniref:Uncharacterized protein n=1 Tax=Pseudoalteromonas denitrificans DSM 6059 TaxID=1123010 RepID=A0A1I1KJD6_9GAMM|nr:hypothetical protein [Pseudoalteromonas denitrificans]SFC58788.1 hypothetical protein SAMN02745724_02045 [Pseudoalteromonas denitrificans DSM 6059]
MSKRLAALFLLLTSEYLSAQCLFVEAEEKIKDVVLIRKQALSVMDAEANKCDDLTDKKIRTACQCQYRKKELNKFREVYKAILAKYPEYDNRLICYSKEGEGISVNFIGYKQMNTWCL